MPIKASTSEKLLSTMKFHSTNKKTKNLSLPDVFRKGLAPDGGLFMPDQWPKLPQDFFAKLDSLSFRQMAFAVISNFVKEIPARKLKAIISDAFNFPVPLKQIAPNLFVLELFHGPTTAFKDFGARFLARALGYFLQGEKSTLNIIVATSGDTGSAVASGFFKVPNIRVFILYPSGKVSPLQEKQLTTYGHNITALEIKGSFDDCQKLAKQVLSDADLNKSMVFSSANSINFGRLLPQSLYYFWAAGRLRRKGINQQPIFVVPSGNFGNLFAGLMAKKMGLPVYKFVAATNINDVVPKYLQTGKFKPKKSKKTISNAMDVGNPSNFARMLELFNKNYKLMGRGIIGYSVTDSDTKKTIKLIYQTTEYICDPHTAVGVAVAKRQQGRQGKRPVIVLSTAHPAKFREIVEPVIGKNIRLPKQLQRAMKKRKTSIRIENNYKDLKKVLLQNI
jgi:threonine synthase